MAPKRMGNQTGKQANNKKDASEQVGKGDIGCKKSNACRKMALHDQLF